MFPFRLSLVPICLPFALLAPHHPIRPCLPPPPRFCPLGAAPRAHARRPLPVGRLSFFTTGLRPGYPLGLASRPGDPAQPSRRGAFSSLALFFQSRCLSPHLSPGWAWLQSPPSPPCRSLRPLLWWSLPNPDASPVTAQPGEGKGWRRGEVKSQARELPRFPNSPVCPCQGGESPLSPTLEPSEKDLE